MRDAILAGGAAVLLSAATATAQDLPGDAEAGHRLARQWCSGCHIVSTERTTMAPDFGPPFPALGRDSAITELSLRAFLRTPHKNMPNLMLSRRETDDLISHILSFRRR